MLIYITLSLIISYFKSPALIMSVDCVHMDAKRQKKHFCQVFRCMSYVSQKNDNVTGEKIRIHYFPRDEER